MELKTLLKNSGWEQSDLEVSKSSISKETESLITKNIGVLIANNYRALALNFLFLSITAYFYWLNPTISFLIPSILVASCFLFLVITSSYSIYAMKEIDHNQSVAVVLKDVLTTNKSIYQNQCKYHSILITQSFLGGFFLGLAFQGWTLDRTLEEPVIFIIVVPASIGIYFFTKTKSFGSFNRQLNPRYFRAKSHLEQQLALLQD